MKYLLLLFVATSCATPVTSQHWVECQIECEPRFLDEACVSIFKGKGCTCEDGKTVWLGH